MLAMASAVLAIPWFIFTFYLAEKGGVPAKTAEAAMLVVGTALTVYLLVVLQRLLHEQYGFREADLPIRLLIKANVVSSAVSLLGLVLTELESAIGVFGIVMVVLVGILQAFFGIRLLRLSDTLRGLQKPYCYLNIVTGICVAAIIAIPLGMITGAVADVMLCTIFFQAASAQEQ